MTRIESLAIRLFSAIRGIREIRGLTSFSIQFVATMLSTRIAFVFVSRVPVTVTFFPANFSGVF